MIHLTTVTAKPRQITTLVRRCEAAMRRLGAERPTYPLQISEAAAPWREHGRVRGAVCVELGVARVGGAWCITTRRAFYEHHGTAPVRTSRPMPLAREDRAVQAAAAPHLPALVGEVALERIATLERIAAGIREMQAVKRAARSLSPAS